jgi:hypothetical protein
MISVGRTARVLVLAAVALGGGCSGGAPAPGPTSGGLQGTFFVSFNEASAVSMTPASASVTGRVFDGPVPQVLQLVLDRQEAGCKLLKARAPFCDPGCTGGDVCVSDGHCQAYPKLQDVGVVHVTGLGPDEVTMEPVVPDKPDYQSVSLPYPPCAEGAAVHLRADAFDVETTCIAPLELTTAVPIPVKRDTAVKLTWKAPGVASLGRLTIGLNIAHHGGKKGEIDCDVPDTGAFDIPAALVTGLIELGVAGNPTIILTREARATAPKAPGVALAVSSALERAVDTGFKDCSDAVPCPAGLTCDTTVYLCK